MNHNFSLKFKIGDIVVGILAAIFIVSSIIGTNMAFKQNLKEDEKSVEIYYDGSLVKNISFVSLKQDEVQIVLRQEEYGKLLGDFTIVINKEKGICVEDVTCPNHTCEHQGWVNRVGMPIVCIPNSVYIILTKIDADYDIIL